MHSQIISRLILGVLFIGSAAILSACGNAAEGDQQQEVTITQPTDIEFPEGLQVEQLRDGNGREIESGDLIQVEYTGFLEDGTAFDSSAGRQPLSFKVGSGQVIPGLDEGLKGMKVGGMRELVIPPELAFGERGAGDAIPPNETIRFEAEIVNAITEPSGIWEYDVNNVETTASGLQMVDITEGEGPEVSAGDRVQVYYDGYLKNGELFDSSFNNGQMLPVQVGQGMVIDGWDEGLQGMKKGGERVLIIPPELAYGDQARGDVIPANATLIFNVRIEGHQPAAGEQTP